MFFFLKKKFRASPTVSCTVKKKKKLGGEGEVKIKKKKKN